MQEIDRRHVCQGLQEIETDLAFELIEAYKAGRLEDFSDTVTLARDLAEFHRILCEP
ncbi:MAG: hypothetical protein HYU03_06275 [Thaumarchaeota archaeon]|nr:hypothetical protein [Nitrososphaerota archaeon]